MSALTTGAAMRIADEMLGELRRLHAAGALFETDLELALTTAREICDRLPDDTGPRLVTVLTAWLHEFRRAQLLRPGASDAIEAAQRAIDDAAGGRGAR